MRLRWLLVWMALLGPGAHAAVTACSVSAPGINFGSYTGTRISLGATPVTVVCPAGQSFTLAVKGAHAGGGGASAMTGPRSSTLEYLLFQNASHTIPWGDAVGVTTVSGTGTGSAQTFTLYPQLAAGQRHAPGVFADTVMMSLQTAAGTFTTSFGVIANADSSCGVVATPLVMGIYTGAVLNQTTTLVVTCTLLTAYSIGLSAGSTGGATTSSREMAGPSSSVLGYGLYQDSGYTKNWGSNVGVDTVAGTGSALPQLFVVYGQIPSKQSVFAGSYSDMVVVTVTY